MRLEWILLGLILSAGFVTVLVAIRLGKRNW